MTGRPASDAHWPRLPLNARQPTLRRRKSCAQLRRDYLDHQIAALENRVRMLKGERLSFDEESRALYDAVAPTYPESHFKAILDQLDRRFPAAGRWSIGTMPGAARLSFRANGWTPSSRRPSTPAAAERSRTCSCRPDEHFTVEVRHEQIVERLQLVSGKFRGLDQAPEISLIPVVAAP